MSKETMKDWQERAVAALMPLYPQKAVALERGEGCYLYDIEGKQYLDCAAGIAVSALGHSNEKLKEAIIDQINKVMMTVGSYPTRPKVEAAELLINNSCFDQIFFCNSGAEAVEGCLKLARKWAHFNKSEDCKEIIAFDHAFHGRTYGAASCTYKADSQSYFAPYLPGVKRATFNDIESVKALVSDKTCAIIVEPVQGEGGVCPATQDFMQGLRDLCDEHEIVLIADEIQMGMGRLGTLFAYEKSGIEPDLISLAKGIGGGFPVGAFMGKKKFTHAFAAGDHGTTYGGNPLATRVVQCVVEQIRQPDFLKNVVETGAYFKEQLQKLQSETNSIEEVRGQGLMIGIDTVYDIKTLLDSLLKNGLIATQAGDKSLRFTPPLIFTRDHVDEAVKKLKTVIQSGDLS